MQNWQKKHWQQPDLCPPSTASGDAILPTTPSSENLSTILGDNTAVIAPGDENPLAEPKLIRVGPRPLQPQSHVTSALVTLAEDHIKFIKNKNLSGADYHLPNTTSGIGKTDAKDLFQTLKSFLTLNGNLATRVC